MDLRPAGLKKKLKKYSGTEILHSDAASRHDMPAIGVDSLQRRQSRGGANDGSDDEILFQTLSPDFLSLLLL